MATTSPRRAPGMFDVARSAGVSHQTVSRVVNDHPNVKPETRARVLAVIEELGYRRNTMARALATNRSGTIGVITNREALYGPTSILLSVEAAARDEGYFVSLVTLTDASTPAMNAALQHFQDQAVEGIIVISASADFMTAAIEVAPRVPVVLVAATSKPLSGFYFASVDNTLGARLAVRHLLDLGHTDIAHVRGPKASLEATARMRAWRQTVRGAGYVPGAVIAGDWTAESGYAAGRRFLDTRLPHAIFAGNDEMALGVLRALTEQGVAVPDQVSLVGFDDIAGSAFFNPPLSTVRQDFASLGHQCLDLLVSAIHGAAHSSPVLVEPTLLVRKSTAARRGS
jgi:DNA-binding LacI/PurR family transcriptional regulator